MKKKFSILIAFAFFLLSSPYFCFGYAFNSGTPLFGQETNFWCGAATGQMILSQGGVNKTQTEIYNTIQTNKKDAGFYTDPDGLALTLDHFDPMYWVVVSGKAGTQDHIIEVLMESMAKFNRPSGLLVDNGNHWVLWDSYVTDIDPLKGDAVLQSSILNDPWPVGSGVKDPLGAAGFKSRFSQNTFGTLYLNDYVGVAPVPEPTTILLLGLGLLFLAGLRRKLQPVKLKK